MHGSGMNRSQEPKAVYALWERKQSNHLHRFQGYMKSEFEASVWQGANRKNRKISKEYIDA